jgi:predicted O-linked N-acetylglucosamine transferase (SPINDLY family)
MSSKDKYTRIVEKELHILVTLTGWTHGHIADVIAGVGSGPSPVFVFNWLGWAGPFMCMLKAVHFTIVGSIALSPRQTLEYAPFRERLATVVPCYQPAQGPLSHPILGANRWTRSHFNLPPAEDNFIYFFGGAINRILEATFYMWLGIVHRVFGACLLLLSRPKGMRTRIEKWIANYIATANPDFDPSRVLFRPFQNKTHFCGMIRAVIENWAGVGLDTVEPFAPHTTANDLHAHGCGILTYVSEGGFHDVSSARCLGAAVGIRTEWAIGRQEPR